MSLSEFSAWDVVSDFLFNPDLRSKVLITSSYVTPVICLIYFLGVTYVAPYLMRNRKPFAMDNLITFYNFALVAFNFHIAYGLIHAGMFSGYMSQSLCPLDSKRVIAEALKHIGVYPWHYMLSKFVELADSIFFALRKRFDLLTALHRLHHALTPFVAWYILQMDLNICLYLGVVLNSTVHVFMYLYYGLAACGLRKYLWWKKYLTMFQILQILTVILCILTSSVTGCYGIQKGEISVLCLCTLVLMLFINYFYKQYSSPGGNCAPRMSSSL